MNESELKNKHNTIVRSNSFKNHKISCLKKYRFIS